MSYKRILIFICFLFNMSLYSHTDRREESELFYGHLRDVAIYAKEKENLSMSAFGGSRPYKIECFNMEFASQQRKTRGEARNQIINIIEYLINKVNQDKKIRPYLNNYPFTEKNVDIIISYKNSVMEKEQDDPWIKTIFFDDGVIRYYIDIDDPKNPGNYCSKEYSRETYEQALKRAPFPDVPPDEKEKALYYVDKELANKHMEAFKAAAKKKGLETDEVHFSIALRQLPYKFSFITIRLYGCDQKFSLDEARKYTVPLIKDMLDGINADEALRPYLMHHPMTTNDLIAHINFYDKKPYDHPPLPHIASVKFYEGKVTYYIFDPAAVNEKFGLGPHKIAHMETWEEALKHLE